jgi:signal transduction histidine kinase
MRGLAGPLRLITVSSLSALVTRARVVPRNLVHIQPLDACLALAAIAALLAEPLLLHKIATVNAGMVVLALAAEVPPLLASLALYHPNRAAAGIVMVLVFTVGLEGDRVRSLVVGAVMAALVVITVFLTSHDGQPFEMVAYTALILAALIAGEALRARRALQRALIEEAARASEAAAQHRFDIERLTLAHELHDAVGHTLVAINVRAAAAARRARKSGGGDGLAALDEIAESSSSALSELRATLKALRAVAGGPAPLQPVQGLTGLGSLIAGVQEAGLSVDLDLAGDSECIPPPVAHAVYRIVQEGLTNVLRHSTAWHARVCVTAGDQAVLVEILDEGTSRVPTVPAAGVPPAGHGLTGMRERAAALGGSCEAGPVNGAGWRVRAQIPVRDSHRTGA